MSKERGLLKAVNSIVDQSRALLLMCLCKVGHGQGTLICPWPLWMLSGRSRIGVHESSIYCPHALYQLGGYYGGPSPDMVLTIPGKFIGKSFLSTMRTLGRPTIKSTEMLSHGRLDIGRSSSFPWVKHCFVLSRRHTKEARTYASISPRIWGQ